jgi:pantothenate synthetase
MKALVPVAAKSGVIHAGHIAVIEYAKSIANEVEVSIIDLNAFDLYIRTDIIPEAVNIDKQIESIKNYKLKF